MNGLKAINNLIYDGFDRVKISETEFSDGCYNCLTVMKVNIISDFLIKVKPEIKVIKNDLKVLQILKEKKVDIDIIKTFIKNNNSIEEMEDLYKRRSLLFGIYPALELGEIKLFVDWLKEE